MGRKSRERKEKHELRELAGYRPLAAKFFEEAPKQQEIYDRIQNEYRQQGITDSDEIRRKLHPWYPLAYSVFYFYSYDDVVVLDGNGVLDFITSGHRVLSDEIMRGLDDMSCFTPPFENLCVEVENVTLENYDTRLFFKRFGFFIKTFLHNESSEFPGFNFYIETYWHGEDGLDLNVHSPLVNEYMIKSLRYEVVLNNDGSMMDRIKSQFAYGDGLDQPMLYFILKLLEFLNMRNVELIDGPPPPPRIQQLHEKHYGEPLYTYKVLSVGQPRKEYTEDAEYEHGTHATPRGHIVRGHPRRVEGHPFIPDGVYWIPAHTRGDFSKGEVFKDYRIVT